MSWNTPTRHNWRAVFFAVAELLVDMQARTLQNSLSTSISYIKVIWSTSRSRSREQKVYLSILVAGGLPLIEGGLLHTLISRTVFFQQFIRTLQFTNAVLNGIAFFMQCVVSGHRTWRSVHTLSAVISQTVVPGRGRSCSKRMGALDAVGRSSTTDGSWPQHTASSKYGVCLTDKPGSLSKSTNSSLSVIGNIAVCYS